MATSDAASSRWLCPTVKDVDDDDIKNIKLIPSLSHSSSMPSLAATSSTSSIASMSIAPGICAQFVYQLLFVFYTMIDLYCLQSRHTNHVYLFYKEVDYNASGTWGEPGDKHFKCHHGPGKILTITKKMQSSLNG